MNRIVAKRTIREFQLVHKDSKEYLETWYQTAKAAQWRKPSDIHSTILCHCEDTQELKSSL